MSVPNWTRDLARYAQARNAATACHVIGRYSETVSPFLTPKPLRTFASAHTSRSSSRYDTERPSPGSSASQMIAVCAAIRSGEDGRGEVRTSDWGRRGDRRGAHAVGCGERPAVDAVVRRVQPALREPRDVAGLEPARADGLERPVPVQRLARRLRAISAARLPACTSGARTLAHHSSESSPTVPACASRYASWSGPTCGFLCPFTRRGAIGRLATVSGAGVSSAIVRAGGEQMERGHAPADRYLYARELDCDDHAPSHPQTQAPPPTCAEGRALSAHREHPRTHRAVLGGPTLASAPAGVRRGGRRRAPESLCGAPPPYLSVSAPGPGAPARACS
jgi:hypothetical protein